MSIIAWIIIGGLAGLIASMITNEGSDSLLMDIVIGVLGAFIGGTVLTFINSGSVDLVNGFSGFNLSSLLVSILGAVILLLVVKLVRKSSHNHI